MVRVHLLFGCAILVVLFSSVLDVLANRSGYAESDPAMYGYLLVMVATGVIARHRRPLLAMAITSLLSAGSMIGVYFGGFGALGEHFSRIDEQAVAAVALAAALVSSSGIVWVIRFAVVRIRGGGKQRAA